MIPSGRTERDGGIGRGFRFGALAEDRALMTRTAVLAETGGHHPAGRDPCNRGDIRVTTHDVEELASTDTTLAHALNDTTQKAQA